MTKTEIIKLFGAVIIFAVVIAIIAVLGRIDAAQTIQLIITFVLVLVTVAYVKRTSDIAKATKEQADASVKMAEEMKEQRITASRPVIIQKAVHEDEKKVRAAGSGDYFSHFEVYNAGNGPAIEVEVSLILQREPPYRPHNCKREGFLLAKDTPIKFYTTFPPDVSSSTFYVVSQYQGIPPYSQQPIWYQTWLPCKLSVSGRAICGKLEFYDDISEKDRISIFSTEFNNRSKPK